MSFAGNRLALRAVLGIQGKLLPELRAERFGNAKRLARYHPIRRFAGIANGNRIGIEALQLRPKHFHWRFNANAKFQQRYQMMGLPEWDGEFLQKSFEAFFDTLLSMETSCVVIWRFAKPSFPLMPWRNRLPPYQSIHGLGAS
jgi:hypothetical protein